MTLFVTLCEVLFKRLLTAVIIILAPVLRYVFKLSFLFDYTKAVNFLISS